MHRSSDGARGAPEGDLHINSMAYRPTIAARNQRQRRLSFRMIRTFSDNKSLQLMKGDITQVPVDAICNAANSQLAGGGGVDGAIHSAGGPSIMRELDEIRAASGGCPTG